MTPPKDLREGERREENIGASKSRGVAEQRDSQRRRSTDRRHWLRARTRTKEASE